MTTTGRRGGRRTAARPHAGAARRHLAAEITLGLTDQSEDATFELGGDPRGLQEFYEDLLRLKTNSPRMAWSRRAPEIEPGGHLWIFFLRRRARPGLPGLHLPHSLRDLASDPGAGLPEGIEIFPRQDEIGAEEFGNAILRAVSAFTVARRTAGAWRFWFYNADYTLG